MDFSLEVVNTGKIGELFDFFDCDALIVAICGCVAELPDDIDNK